MSSRLAAALAVLLITLPTTRGFAEGAGAPKAKASLAVETKATSKEAPAAETKPASAQLPRKQAAQATAPQPALAADAKTPNSPTKSPVHQKKLPKKVISAAAPLKTLPPLLADVEANYSKSGTVTADFKETDISAATTQKSEKSGTLMLKRPDKLRWQLNAPDATLTVSDGKTFWLYTPPFDEGEAGRVIESRSVDIQSKLLNSLLAGRFSQVKGLTIKPNGENKFLLLPKKGTAGSVVSIDIEVDPTKKLIQKVKLDHRGGNHSEFTLGNVEIGKDLKDDLFQFKAPPNTERIKPE